MLNPTLVAILGGAVLGLCGVGKVLPGFVDTSLRNLSGCMGPVAMVLTGFIIGGYSVPSLLKNKKVYAVTFLRLFVLPAVCVAVVVLLGASKTVAQLTLIASGTALGLKVKELPRVERKVADYLKNGDPVIVSMGPGNFDNFVVLTGYKDGRVTINDPDSRVNSEKEWVFADIADQMRNLWVIQKGI